MFDFLSARSAGILDAFWSFAANPALVPALLAIALAGLVRGFAGFGGAMLFMPFASFLFDPRLAVVAFFIIDALVTLPLVAGALRRWDVRTVLPCAVGAWVGVWFGALMLATADPLVLRWLVCGIIIALVALMASGWRYTGAPKPPVSLAVGATAGVFGGISQVSGPPVVAYWVSGPSDAARIRANLITFFFLSSLGTMVAFLGHGVFTEQSAGLALWLAPVYGLALLIGARLFRGARESVFRKVAFGMILMAAVTSLPVLDPLLRG